MPCLLFEFNISEIETLWLSRIEIRSAHSTIIFSIFSVKAGWIVAMLFMLLLPILLCNGQNKAEYEAYWLMSFPIINLWGARFMSVFSIFSFRHLFGDFMFFIPARMCFYCRTYSPIITVSTIICL